MIRIYEEKDYKTIAHWMSLRDRAPMPEWSIPPSGFIVDDVAAGFLTLTNNYVGILDFYISNPFSSSRERNQALDFITKELIEFAKVMGCKMITCSSQVNSIQSRALKHGFKKDGDFIFYSRSV